MRVLWVLRNISHSKILRANSLAFLSDIYIFTSCSVGIPHHVVAEILSSRVLFGRCRLIYESRKQLSHGSCFYFFTLLLLWDVRYNHRTRMCPKPRWDCHAEISHRTTWSEATFTRWDSLQNPWIFPRDHEWWSGWMFSDLRIRSVSRSIRARIRREHTSVNRESDRESCWGICEDNWDESHRYHGWQTWSHPRKKRMENHYREVQNKDGRIPPRQEMLGIPEFIIFSRFFLFFLYTSAYAKYPVDHPRIDPFALWSRARDQCDRDIPNTQERARWVLYQCLPSHKAYKWVSPLWRRGVGGEVKVTKYHRFWDRNRTRKTYRYLRIYQRHWWLCEFFSDW